MDGRAFLTGHARFFLAPFRTGEMFFNSALKQRTNLINRNVSLPDITFHVLILGLVYGWLFKLKQCLPNSYADVCMIKSKPVSFQ